MLSAGYGISLFHHQAAVGGNSRPSIQIWGLNVTALKSEYINSIIEGILINWFSSVQNQVLKQNNVATSDIIS
jgi:hypothetical protein